MDDVTKYFPVFTKFLNEVSDRSISDLESIYVEKFFNRTVIAERSPINCDFIKSREINCKLILNVRTYDSLWKFNQHVITNQFSFMFKRQFKSIDFDQCLVVLNDVNEN